MSRFFLPILLIFAGSPLLAQLECAQIFSDHMVLQREREIQIWGWHDPRSTVTVTMNEVTVTERTNQEGRWQLTLPAMEAGGPYLLTVTSGRETITFSDVWIGDVWLCSGQSNMEWPMAAVNNAEAEIASADHPMIRLFDVPHQISLSLEERLPSTTEGWKICSPEAVRTFSAVAFFMARELQPELGVPIGLVSSNWGGTIVETWTSREAIMTDPDFSMFDAENLEEGMRKKAEAAKQKMEEFLREFSPGSEMTDGVYTWQEADANTEGWKTTSLPGLWEDSDAPGFDGSMWYRKSVTLTREEAESGATIFLGKIDDHDITWINGQEIGRIEMYNEFRAYPVPEGVLKEGENIIAVRVMDTGGGGGFWGESSDMRLESGDYIKPLAGSWIFRPGVPLENAGSGGIGPNDAPTLLYNGMIHPIFPYTLKGAIWYQGESNADRAAQYQRLFPLMINDWRDRWGYEFPFLWVQLANFMAEREEPGQSNWAELREAQSMTLTLPHTGQAVIIDIGEADDIHPRNKQDVGKRLALSALHVAYDQELVHSGPVFTEMEIRDGAAYLTFEEIGSGLEAMDKYGYIKGMAIAGEDREWHWAMAIISGDGEVKVWSPQVPNPVAVRYGWADNPADVNLYNVEGLPASPFRTDSW